MKNIEKGMDIIFNPPKIYIQDRKDTKIEVYIPLKYSKLIEGIEKRYIYFNNNKEEYTNIEHINLDKLSLTGNIIDLLNYINKKDIKDIDYKLLFLLKYFGIDINIINYFNEFIMNRFSQVS